LRPGSGSPDSVRAPRAQAKTRGRRPPRGISGLAHPAVHRGAPGIGSRLHGPDRHRLARAASRASLSEAGPEACGRGAMTRQGCAQWRGPEAGAVRRSHGRSHGRPDARTLGMRAFRRAAGSLRVQTNLARHGIAPTESPRRWRDRMPRPAKCPARVPCPDSAVRSLLAKCCALPRGGKALAHRAVLPSAHVMAGGQPGSCAALPRRTRRTREFAIRAPPVPPIGAYRHGSGQTASGLLFRHADVFRAGQPGQRDAESTAPTAAHPSNPLRTAARFPEVPRFGLASLWLDLAPDAR